MSMNKSLRLIRVPFIKLLNFPLHYIECRNFKAAASKQLPYPPIFIIGAPRSGTTLLYQSLTEYFDVAYLSNLHCIFYGAPSIVEKMLHPLRWRRPSDYSSRYGRTKGLTAPSECRRFWYRFFPRNPLFATVEDVSIKNLQRFRSVIANLVEEFEKPLVTKNVYNSLRLLPLAHILPEALFIVIRRSEVDNARSLLASRRYVFGTYEKWWSLEPPQVNLLKEFPPHIQVVEQIRGTYRLINKHKYQIGEHRFYEINYEDLCAKPNETMEGIGKFLISHSININRRGNLPDSFVINRKASIDRNLEKKLIDYLMSSSKAYKNYRPYTGPRGRRQEL